jgi:hypothetical protein
MKVDWNRVRDAKGYIVSIGVATINPSFWPRYPVCEPTDTYTATGLDPDREYGVIVYTNCTSCEAFNNADRKSDDRTMVKFKTAASGTSGLSGTGLPWIVTTTTARIFDNDNNMVGVVPAGTRLGTFYARNERWIWFKTYDGNYLKVRAFEAIIE